MRRRLSIIIALLAVAGFSIAAMRGDFALSRNIEIMVNLMREISENYVDKVEPDQLLEYAAEGISRRLDPYTEYLPEEEMSSFELLTTGKYGGIGSLIRQDSDYVRIAQPYAGSPADKAGLIIGDMIIEIDGHDAAGMTTSQVSERLKGTPSSNVELIVRRLVSGEDEAISITRERIAIPSIPYYGFVGEPTDSIGYIYHSDFTVGAAKDMRTAIEAMQGEGLKALILDYRNNGGGIMQEAVDIVSLFTPRGTEVVTLKGRRDSVVYRTSNRPIAPELPLVVLINENSASASEIVAGALQDLDRAVLVGAKSFGKGLVQSPRPVGYNSYVKMTTAKYYIPSGRCIQELDYSDHSSSRRAQKVADSLRHEFHTRGGRRVYDGGGISPDVEIEPEYISRFASTLYALGYIDNFGDIYYRRNHSQQIDPQSFTISDEDYLDFCHYISQFDVPYQSATRGVLKALKEAAKEDLYTDIAEQIASIEEELKDDTASNLESYRKEIIESINANLILRYAYQEGVICNSLTRDTDLLRAIEILDDEEHYNAIINPKK